MASKTSEIKTKFTVSGEQQYKDALKGIAGEQKNLAAEIKSYDRQLKNLGNSQEDQQKKTELLKKKTEALAKEYNLQKDRIKELNGAMEAAKKHYGENSDQVKDYQRQIHTAEGYLSDFEKQLKDTAEELGKQESKLHQVGEAAGRMGEKFSDAGAKLTKGVTAPLAGVGAASLLAWNEIDKATDGIITATGASGAALEDLENVFKKVYGSMPVEADQVSAAIGELNTQFGLTGDALEGATTSVLQFAKINGADVTTSVQGAKKVIESFGLSADDLGRVLDNVNLAGQNTGVSVDKLFDVVNRNSQTLKDMNLSFEESVVLASQLEQAGIDSSKALSYMSKAAVTLGKDGKDLKTELVLLGSAIRDGADETEIFNRAATLFGTKGAQELRKALESGKLDFAALADAAEAAAGSVSTTFEATLDPMDQWKVALNNLKLAGAEMGGAILTDLTPAIEGMLGGIQDLTEWFSNLDESTQQTIVKLGLFATAAGPVLSVLGKTASGVELATKWAGKLHGVLGEQGLIGVLTSHKGGLIALGGALAAVIGIKVYKAFTGVTPEVKKLKDEIKDTNDSLEKTVKGYDDNAVAAKGLSDRIFKLAETENKTTAQKKALAAMVAELNEKVPGLNLAYDAQTDSLNKTKSATYDLIEAKKAEAKASANMDALIKKYEQQALLEEEIAKLEASIAEREAKGESGVFWGDLAKERRSLDDAKKSLGELNEEIEFSEKYVRELNNSSQELNDTIDKTRGAMDGAGDAAMTAARANEELKAKQEEVIESYRSQGDAYAKFSDEAILKINDFVEANAEAYAALTDDERAFFDAKIAGAKEVEDLTVDSLHAMYEAQEAAQQAELESYKQHLDRMTGAKISQNELTAQEMLENLEANQATYEAYYANRLTLQQRLQGEEYDALREHLLSLGVENTDLLNEMVNATDEELLEYAEAFNRAGESAKNYASENTKAAVGAVSEAIQEGIGDVEINADELNEAIISAFNDLGGELDLTTKEGIAALAQAIVDNTTLPESEAEALAEAVKTALGKGTEDGKTTGQEIAEQYSVGIKDKEQEAEDAAGKIKDKAVEALDDKGKAKEQAEKTADEYIKTFEGKAPDAEAAGTKLGEAPVSGLKGATDGKGLEIAGNFADTAVQAVLDREGDMYNAGSVLGNAASRGYQDSLQIRSPSRVAKKDSQHYIEGLLEPIKAGVSEMYAASRRLGEAASKGYQDVTAAPVQSAPANAPAVKQGGDTINVNIGNLPPGMTSADARELGETIAKEIQRQKYAKGVRV